MQIYTEELNHTKIVELINATYESDSLDFKEVFDQVNDKKSYLEIIKDIVAFANTEGGYIIFGVEDDTYEKIGVDDETNIDATKLGNLLDQYVDEHIKFVVSNYSYNSKKFIIVFVEKLEKIKPAIFKKDGIYHFNNKDKHAFKASTVYVRKATKSEENLAHWFNIKGIEYGSLNLPKYGYVDNLPKPNYGENFVGRETDLKILLDGLLKEEHTYRILIHGIGGLGKTALAQKTAYTLKSMANNNEIGLDYIFWISAKSEEYTISSGIKPIQQDFNNINDVLNNLSKLFNIKLDDLSIEEQKILITDFIKNKVGILIIDNWETVNDSNDELLEFLLRLPGKNKIIVTSRYKIVDQQFKNLSPSPMIEEQGVQFLQKWIHNFNDDNLNNLSNDILFKLAASAGGIPIAMIMAIGQVSLGKPISDVISDLNDFDIDDPLLEFCFRETYKRLTENEKKILLSLTFFSNSVKKQVITSMVELSSRDVSSGLQKLVKHSFLDVIIDNSNVSQNNVEIYKINPITKSFLKQQLISVPEINELLEENYQMLSIEMENLNKKEISSMNSVIEKLDFVSYEDKLAASFAASATRVWKSTKDWDKALKKFEKAKIISPQLGYIYGQWAWVCENAGEKKLARENYHKAIQLDENNIKLWYQWAMFELLKGDYREAESKFSTVLSKTPDDSRSWHGLARVKIKRHENGEKQNLHDIPPILQRGFINKNKLNYSEKKHNSVNCYYLAKIFLELDNYVSANKYVEIGLKYLPNDDFLKKLKQKINQKSRNNHHKLDAEKKSNGIINGKVLKIINYGAFLTDNYNNKQYFLHISQISNSFINNINEELVVGQSVDFKIINPEIKGKLANVTLLL
ncbi:RNA-binding domain-containing protein [Lysinibacillus capsici]|uniref:RNA-binding domain-containing protein n=1 Tax=Lysinibacillus capsici TaxID=2115968 RepID=UPI002E1B3C42|nr:putative DNA binding domain-containing protein [Lysinibacillus capsici]